MYVVVSHCPMLSHIPTVDRSSSYAMTVTNTINDRILSMILIMVITIRQLVVEKCGELKPIRVIYGEKACAMVFN